MIPAVRASCIAGGILSVDRLATPSDPPANSGLGAQQPLTPSPPKTKQHAGAVPKRVSRRSRDGSSGGSGPGSPIHSAASGCVKESRRHTPRLQQLWNVKLGGKHDRSVVSATGLAADFKTQRLVPRSRSTGATPGGGCVVWCQACAVGCWLGRGARACLPCAASALRGACVDVALLCALRWPGCEVCASLRAVLDSYDNDARAYICMFSCHRQSSQPTVLWPSTHLAITHNHRSVPALRVLAQVAAAAPPRPLALDPQHSSAPA